VVTGVSTGALQATFAFLGRDYDDELASAYAITSERQLLKRHGAGFFLAHGSMTDTAPLNTYLREKLRPLLDQVAAPEHAGRKLLVGLVNGLDGRMYAADLTRIAAERSGQEREECYTAALLASASVPVVFRQTTINGRPYLDGGVRQSVFVTEVQEATSSVISAADRTGAIYVLMNGDVAPKEVASLPAKLLPTLNRLRTIVFNQVELSSIFSVAQRFPRMATYVATAAGQNCDAVSDEESEIFQPATMRCLSDYGYRRWKEGSVPWTAYDRPDIQPEPLN
jgi:predicted acylesterase/phospholipase RssA